MSNNPEYAPDLPDRDPSGIGNAESPEAGPPPQGYGTPPDPQPGWVPDSRPPQK